MGALYKPKKVKGRLSDVDVAQNIAQELIFYCYGEILIGGPLKAFWALGESRGPDTSVRKSPWDQKYL